MSVSQGSKILASDCVSTNTASTLVLRDANGDFSAGTITSSFLKIKPSKIDANQSSYINQYPLRIDSDIGNTSSTSCHISVYTRAIANQIGEISLYLGNSLASSSVGNLSGVFETTRSGIGAFLKMRQNVAECGRIELTTLGPANTEGIVTLVLGNSTAKTAANNASGKIQLYNSNGSSVTITAKYGVLSDVHASNNQHYIEIGNYTKGTFIGTYYGSIYYGKKSTAGYYFICYQNYETCGGLRLENLGIANTEGHMTLTLGNATAKTAANNASGKIELYNSNGSPVSLTANYEQWPTISGNGNVLVTTHIRTDTLYPKYGLFLGDNAASSAPSSTISTRLVRIIPPYHSANGNYWELRGEDSSSNAFINLQYNTTTIAQIRHDGAIKGSFITKLDTGNITFTSSTSWFYTGASVTIPAYCYYFIWGQAIYANNGPTRVALSTTSTPTAGWAQAISYYGAQGYAGYVSMCGYTSSAITLYLHAVYNGASSNWARITGGYIQSWE